MSSLSHPAFAKPRGSVSAVLRAVIVLSLVFAAVLGACASPAPVGTAAPTQTAVPGLSADQRAKIFDEVWGTVQKRYLYADFHGVDWNAMRSEYRPRALSARDSSGFYAAVSEMVSRLKDDHSRYIGPLDAKQEDAVVTGRGSYVGIGVVTAPRPGALVVQYVLAGSPAQKAGIRRRDRILALDGKSPPTPELIHGASGTSVELLVKPPGIQAHLLRVVRGPVQTKISPMVYRLPFRPSVVYAYVPSLWPEDTARLLEEGLQRELGAGRADAVVLDLRGNGGGWRQSLEGALSLFASGTVGSFYSRSSSYSLTVKPGKLYPQTSRLKLAVLVDRDTASYAEVLAAVLRTRAGAVAAGSPTAGNTETVYEYNYADGSRLWVAQEGFRLPSGVNLEGRGVAIDVPVPDDWTLYPEAEDPVILKALQRLGLR